MGFSVRTNPFHWFHRIHATIKISLESQKLLFWSFFLIFGNFANFAIFNYQLFTILHIFDPTEKERVVGYLSHWFRMTKFCAIHWVTVRSRQIKVLKIPSWSLIRPYVSRETILSGIPGRLGYLRRLVPDKIPPWYSIFDPNWDLSILFALRKFRVFTSNIEN